MRVGKNDARLLVKKTSGVTNKEKKIMAEWEQNDEVAKVTTHRMFPSTVELVSNFSKENFKVVPEYVVFDKIVKLGIESLEKEKL